MLDCLRAGYQNAGARVFTRGARVWAAGSKIATLANPCLETEAASCLLHGESQESNKESPCSGLPPKRLNRSFAHKTPAPEIRLQLPRTVTMGLWNLGLHAPPPRVNTVASCSSKPLGTPGFAKGAGLFPISHANLHRTTSKRQLLEGLGATQFRW